MFEVNNFDSIKIGLASPEKIKEWSSGEVTKPETINYRTQKPERGGLFCQKIFGPIKDYTCECGRYNKMRHKNIICDKCGVKVEKSIVRRERMGHIDLAAPVSHLWYLKGGTIATVLGMKPKEVESVIYFANFAVTDPGETDLHKRQVLDEKDYKENLAKWAYLGEKSFKVGMGAEVIKQFLKELDIDAEITALRKGIDEDQKSSKSSSRDSDKSPKKLSLSKRLELLEAFKSTGSKPEWMILDRLPVLPPELRPMVPLEGGRYATSDLNDLYRFVIARNNRLKSFVESGGVEVIIRNEKRMLQVAVDNLIDNAKRAKASTSRTHELKSLTSMLKGKQGRFRQNLLGKRVDYSGRSVIVVGPELKMYQCGLPKEMALELFKPFIMCKLTEKNICNNIKVAKAYVERAKPEVWEILEEVIKDHPVLLNRAPTLHRLGIQAFEPVLVEGRALKLHPLVCGAFNADFDGDQMAVHLPLSIEAQTEARFLMLSTNNILRLSDGSPIALPSQDMVLGSYYMTIEKPYEPKRDDETEIEYRRRTERTFMSVDEAKMAYQTKNITLQSPIRVKITKEIDGKMESTMLRTTVGRLIFNEAIPQDLGLVPRDTVEQKLALEINKVVDKKMLGTIVGTCYRLKGSTETAEVLDKIKAQGYKYSTLGALTTSVFDMSIPEEKAIYIAEGDKEVAKQQKQYERGLLSKEEREESSNAVWSGILEKLKNVLKTKMDVFNPIKMMMDSGARGSIDQTVQLAGMRGLMKDPSGRTIELPIKSNFREGLSALEYFISTHGGRKGLSDTALKTAESGYLTRRLVEIAQPVIIVEYDCGDEKGFEVEEFKNESASKDKDAVVESLQERIEGRYSIKQIEDPSTGEVLVPADTMITREMAKAVEDAGIKKVTIRSVLSCKHPYGLCAKCYGANMGSGSIVKIGEAVGLIAAQSIGEPGTQLTMRTFHTGGVAGAEDITQGLPRVQELFECRNGKAEAVIAPIAGIVSIQPDKNNTFVIVITPSTGNDPVSLKVAYGLKLLVKDGDFVQPGTPMTNGSIKLKELLAISGVKVVQNYLIKEVLKAYRGGASVKINDKHVEIIIRQMLRKVRVENPGDSGLLPGEFIDESKFDEILNEVALKGGELPRASHTIMGITKASLHSESFLSAASFQETTHVLTDAAIKGKEDPLRGPKENVLLGKLIPAGTGLKRYSSITVTPATKLSEAPIDIPDIPDED